MSYIEIFQAGNAFYQARVGNLSSLADRERWLKANSVLFGFYGLGEVEMMSSEDVLVDRNAYLILMIV